MAAQPSSDGNRLPPRGDLHWQTIPRLLVDAADQWSSNPAIVDGETQLSFDDLKQAAFRSARGFLAAGIEAGDRIAIWAPNVAEWVTAALGVHCVGGVVVPLNTRFKGHEAGYVLDKSRARMLFTVNGFLDTNYVEMLRSADQLGPHSTLEQIVILRGSIPEGARSYDEFCADGETHEDAAVSARIAALTSDDLSDIMFTSGTTGHPKGVMTTHGQSLRAYTDWSRVVGLGPDDRYLVVNPFFHGFGYKAGWLASLICGATVYPHAVFDVPSVMAAVSDYRISMLPGPPALYQTILNHPDLADFDMSSLRLAVTGAAAIPVELILDMRERLHFETIVTGYGLTESSGIATMCRHDDDPETIATTSGRAIPDIEVLVVDPDGNELPRGEPGEVVVRGYTVTQGYLEDPDATAEAIDSEGWLHTGDIGVMNPRGYLDITDRLKDMFIVGGFNAYPAEIENDLLAHEAIGQVAVIGIPDERLGEVGAAFVVLRPGAALQEDELIAWCRDRIANYKVPRAVRIVDELPTNASGKVLKRELQLD